MTSTAIVLAGGLGTRLRHLLPDIPKVLAPVAGKPFLYHVVNHLRSQGVSEFIFSLGHMKELVVQFLYDELPTLDFKLSVEDEPLGTGGAVLLAAQQVSQENVIVVNGDTLFRFRLPEMEALHRQTTAACTVALKPMQHFSRYGAVELNDDQSIKQFREKQFLEAGLVNGGIYLLRFPKFLQTAWPEKFSFETDFLEKTAESLFGSVQDEYFIDIGVPEDYQRAQEELRRPPLDLGYVNRDWSVFLDRDGVINVEKIDGYILDVHEFTFCPGALESFPKLAECFRNIVVVTNQRGVGRGLMSAEDLEKIHGHMAEEVNAVGGRLDKVYVCTSTDNRHPERKPNPGMAFRAAREIPGMDLNKSIMVGNKLSDMRFGRSAGMYTVFIRSVHPEQPLPHPDIDMAFDSLTDFAKAL